MKQDKYTMDPGRQIYLSNNKKNVGQKWFLNKKIKKYFQKFFFSEKKLGKTKFGKKDFLTKKIFSEKKFEKNLWKKIEKKIFNFK